MARKITPKDKPAAAASSEAAGIDAARDLNTLVPDVQIDIAGRKLVLKEYRFAASLRARGQAAALIDDLDGVLGTADPDAAADASIDVYLELSGRHDALVRQLMAESIEGADAAFIDGLATADGQALLLAWWEVTGRFFWRAAVQRQIGRILAKMRRARQSDGQTSSPPSSPQDTETSSASQSATPSIN